MPTSSSILPIDFARDNRWFAQLDQGDILAEEEVAALWRDLLACYKLAQTFELTLAAVDVRVAHLEAENARLRQALTHATTTPCPSNHKEP